MKTWINQPFVSNMMLNPPSKMNDEDIKQFLSAFADFMDHAEENIHSYEQWKEAEEYTNQFYEKKAAELEVTVDYYMAEFL